MPGDSETPRLSSLKVCRIVTLDHNISRCLRGIAQLAEQRTENPLGGSEQANLRLGNRQGSDHSDATGKSPAS